MKADPSSSARAAGLLMQDAMAQSEALARGDCSSLQLTQTVLTAIGERNPVLNAYLHVDADGALAAAADSDQRRAAGRLLSAFDGLTLAVKDNIDVAGMPTTAGMATRRGSIAAADAVAVEQLRSAGMVVLGKTNMHEAALGATNLNPHFGRCEHPQHPGFTPGGSSGGSACAVAAGLCALALGTDTMGSVRLPASYCGVVGFKAGYGVVSTRGSVACGFALDHIGTLARSLRDLRVLVPLLARFDPLCADARAARPLPVVERPRFVAAADVGALGVDAEVAAAYEQALDALKARGDTVVRIEIGGLNRDRGAYDFGRARRAGLLVVEADLLIEHAVDWREQPQQFSPELAKLMRYAEAQTASAYAAALRTMASAHIEVARWFIHGDVMLLPTTPQTAFAFDAPVPSNQADLTSIANMAGVPALSLPLPVASAGANASLPIGLQCIAPAGGEATLLQLDLQGIVAA